MPETICAATREASASALYADDGVRSYTRLFEPEFTLITYRKSEYYRNEYAY